MLARLAGVALSACLVDFSTGDAPGVCGDGVADPGEQCDVNGPCLPSP